MSINSATAPGSWISRLSPPQRIAAILLVILAVIAAILIARTHMRPRPPVLPAAQANMLGLRMAEAAENRDDDTVRALLKQGANPDRPSRDGSPALLWATHFSNAAQVKLLIAYGADVNSANRFGLTALHLASGQGDSDIAKILLDAGARADTPGKVGETPLMMASRQGSAEIVAMLLKAGAPVNAREPVHGVTALMLAGWFAHPDVTRELLDAHADISLSTIIGPTPKSRPPNPPGGGSHGDGIIRSGIPPQGERAPIPGGMTALLYAVRAGDLESAKMLVAAGAPLEKGEANGVRPLLMAILNDRIDLAHYFIGLGANVNATDWYGRSPALVGGGHSRRGIGDRRHTVRCRPARCLDPDRPVAAQGRQSQLAAAGISARAHVADAGRHPRLGGFYRPDSVPAGGFVGRRHGDEAADQVPRRSQYPDPARHHAADGGGGRQLGILPDL